MAQGLFWPGPEVAELRPVADLPAREARPCLAGCPGGKGCSFGDHQANSAATSPLHMAYSENEVGGTNQTRKKNAVLPLVDEGSQESTKRKDGLKGRPHSGPGLLPRVQLRPF